MLNLPPNDGSWEEYRMHVVTTLQRIESLVKTNSEDITSLKIKTAAWGLIAGIAGWLLSKLAEKAMGL